MKNQFWNLVPGPAKATAFTLVGMGILIGLAVGIRNGLAYGQPPLWTSALGVVIGLLAGSLIAFWILCLGFVYADARRRAMPAVLWTLLAALVPNLLGFLFYFALRRPNAAQCPRCGRLVEGGQRFCSSCGLEQSSSTQFPFPSGSDATQTPAPVPEAKIAP